MAQHLYVYVMWIGNKKQQHTEKIVIIIIIHCIKNYWLKTAARRGVRGWRLIEVNLFGRRDVVWSDWTFILKIGSIGIKLFNSLTFSGCKKSTRIWRIKIVVQIYRLKQKTISQFSRFNHLPISYNSLFNIRLPHIKIMLDPFLWLFWHTYTYTHAHLIFMMITINPTWISLNSILISFPLYISLP